MALLALFFVVPAIGHAGPERAPTSTHTSDLSTIHIANFGRVNANYFRGGEPDDREYANLAAFGIKTVIDLRSDDTEAGDRQLVEAAGMKYVQIPMTTHVTPTSAMIQEFLAIVETAVNQPVYVHCVGGRHRTGVMTAIYRMTQDGWSADQAFNEMKQYKFGADFLHPEFAKFVHAYHPVVSVAGNSTEVAAVR
jgi:tyrosine-protein phosphatase SIW14